MITVRQVSSHRDLKEFIEFPDRLYKGNPWYVPKLKTDEYDTLEKDSNPAFAFSEAAYFLAEKDGKTVGRIAAIINNKANEKWNHKEVRFGWIDFIDDKEVSAALLEKVVEFGRSRGMDTIVGPLGFTDFDAEGMLVEGYDQLCTMALIYNYPYYKEHLEALGYTKEVDWLEYKIFIPEQLPDKIIRVSKIVEQRFNLHVRKLTKKEITKGGYGQKLFRLVNDSYSDLYNFTPLSEEMINLYIGKYLGLLDLDFVTIVEDKDGEIAGFAITMPSITRALQKCGGRLFPFGWFHILKSLFWKHEESVELLITGTSKEYRGKGLLALIFSDLIPRFRKGGFVFGESNAELEDNKSMSNTWDGFETEQTKRRRIYRKSI